MYRGMESPSFVNNVTLPFAGRRDILERCKTRSIIPTLFKRGHPVRLQAHASAVGQQPFNFILDDASTNVLAPNTPSNLPILVYLAGMDGTPLPLHQRVGLRKYFNVLSICHSPSDRSDWEDLVSAAAPALEILSSNGHVTVLGESFGAALALRLAAACPDAIYRLLLLNPGTALGQDAFLNNATKLLPILALDRSQRFIYKAAAIFLFQVLLTQDNRLAEDCVPDEPRWLRSVDIDRVPLQAMLHRVDLLRHFSETFSDRCIRDLVHAPTVLLASGKDRLLQSRREVARLAALLRNVEKRLILGDSAHAALLEKDVKLSDILVQEGWAGSQTTNQNESHKVSSVSASMRDANYNRALEDGKRFFEPWRQVTAPFVLGKENVVHGLRTAEEGRRRPLLFVGNHSVFGILDLSVFYIELQEILEDRRLRSLADPIHFDLFSEISGGRWERFVTDLGAVPATPRNFYRLLSAGENILLFPGGAREVCRRRGESYKLFWKPDVDFIRPAAKFDAIIIPFSAVGADDSVDILVDGQELQRLPHIGDIVKGFLDRRELSSANLMPIASFPPKPDRFYFKFHQPVDTKSIDPSDGSTCKEVYIKTKDAVERGMHDLLTKREADPERRFDSRVRKHIFGESIRSARGPPSLRSLFNSILPEFEL